MSHNRLAISSGFLTACSLEESINLKKGSATINLSTKLKSGIADESKDRSVGDWEWKTDCENYNKMVNIIGGDLMVHTDTLQLLRADREVAWKV